MPEPRNTLADRLGSSRASAHAFDGEASRAVLKRLLEWYYFEKDRQSANRLEMAMDCDFHDNLPWDAQDAALLRKAEASSDSRRRSFPTDPRRPQGRAEDRVQPRSRLESPPASDRWLPGLCCSPTGQKLCILTQNVITLLIFLVGRNVKSRIRTIGNSRGVFTPAPRW